MVWSWEFSLPKIEYIGEDYSPLTLTLHAIDTQYYQVAALIEDSPMEGEGEVWKDKDEQDDQLSKIQF